MIVIVAFSPTLTSAGIGAVNTYSSSTPYLYLDTIILVELEPYTCLTLSFNVILISYVPSFKVSGIVKLNESTPLTDLL